MTRERNKRHFPHRVARPRPLGTVFCWVQSIDNQSAYVEEEVSATSGVVKRRAKNVFLHKNCWRGAESRRHLREVQMIRATYRYCRHWQRTLMMPSCTKSRTSFVVRVEPSPVISVLPVCWSQIKLMKEVGSTRPAFHARSTTHAFCPCHKVSGFCVGPTLEIYFGVFPMIGKPRPLPWLGLLEVWKWRAVRPFWFSIPKVREGPWAGCCCRVSN